MDELYDEYKTAIEGNEKVLHRSQVGKKIRVLFPDAERRKVTDPLGRRRPCYGGLVRRSE